MILMVVVWCHGMMHGWVVVMMQHTHTTQMVVTMNREVGCLLIMVSYLWIAARSLDALLNM